MIAGPTASGKSQLALKLALQTSGIIINTDSLQIYDVLNILTARPSSKELAQAPHYLYGHISPAEAFSTGRWLDNVKQLLLDKTLKDKTYIFVGGTGLYFHGLIKGIAQMPTVPIDIRQKWRNHLSEKGSPFLHEILTKQDMEMAKRLNPNDGQRVIRALEILDATQKSLSWWQAQTTKPLINVNDSLKIVLMPERESNKKHISLRLDQMVKQGVIEEVEKLLAMGLPATMPAMKAIGVRTFGAYLKQKTPLETALEQTKIETYQYAKRQMTWFRNQFKQDWQHFDNHEHAFKDVQNTIKKDYT